MRKYNDKKQIWYKDRKAYELKNYMATEEGLATLNQLLDKALNPKRQPFLFNCALAYYSAFIASTMSFRDLYKELEKYVDDPEER